tara:strand:- start:737 stop:2209 length:1473 start_codon:yes stop_codon:yes gene_type:complete
MTATVIQVKRTSTANIPSTTEQGELFYVYDTSNTGSSAGNNGKRLFIGDPSNNSNTPIKIGGQYYTDLVDHTLGTLTASAAILVDSNKKIDNLKVDFLDLDGRAITSTDTNGDIEITPNGTGSVVIDGLNYPQADGTNNQVIKTDGNGNLSFTSVGTTMTFTGDSGGSDSLNLTSDTITFEGTNPVNTAITNNKVTISLSSDTVTIGSTGISLGNTANSLTGLQSLNVDDITVDGNSISTSSGNTNVDITPHGTGTVVVPSDYTTRAGFGATSLATKSYVDAVKTGLDVKDSVRAATTANITIASALNNGDSLDGVTLATNDRVLVKNQSTASENGIYIVGASPSRATDFDSTAEVSGGTFVFVEEGTLNGDHGFVVTTDGSVTVGSTSITFTQFSGAGSFVAGNGLTRTGNQLDVASLPLDSASSITGTLPIGNGGTGITSAAKGSVLIANTANTFSALDGGGSLDKFLLYSASTDTISWSNIIDGGTF